MTRRSAPYARYSEEDDILHVRVVAVEFVNAAIEDVDLAAIPERDTVAQLIHAAGVQLPVRVLPP